MFKVQHFDMPADDEERASHFYSHIFGWNVKAFPVGDQTYHMLQTGEVDENGRGNEANVIGGGIYKRSGPDDGLTIWANVEDIDKVVDMAEGHGGKLVMPKMEMGDMGWGAKIKDTEGNVVGIWQDKKK